MSVYDPKAFDERVNYAASRIVRETGVPQGRCFDTCFEMCDGDYVIEALRRRAERNPKLAARLPQVICASAIEESRAKYGRLSRRELASAARAEAMGARVEVR